MKQLKKFVDANPSTFRIPFNKLRDKVLGKKYDLSLVFIGKLHSRKLNRIYRGKNKPTNVLSFPISETAGEIFIDLETAHDEMANFGMNFEKFVKYLFIHGLLHLKGMDHGRTMDKAEKKLLNGTSNRSRN